MFISCVLNAKIIDFNTALKLTLKNNKELKAKKTKIEQAKLNLAKAKGYNFSDRLHIRVWDANKGV